MRRALAIAVGLCGLAGGLARAADEKPKEKAKPDNPFTTAREHLQKGRYDEALEACEALEKAKADAASLALIRSECHEAEGRWKEATETLVAATKAVPRSAAVWARLAEVRFRQGDYPQAAKDAEQALKLDEKNLRAKLVRADLDAETGRIKEANVAYREFVRYYNKAQPEDAETLVLVGLGSAQYARWNSVSTVFNFLVNTLENDALKDDPNCWQVMHLAGSLLLEKYNRKDALPELKKALAVNPRSADVLASLAEAALHESDYEEGIDFADQALKINPHHIGALMVRADVALSRGGLSEVEGFVTKALEVNPREQRVLARQAAVALLRDGIPEAREFDGLLSNLDAIEDVKIEKPSRFTSLVIDLAKRNPRPGPFLSILGDALSTRRKYDAAERVYRHCIAVMPQLSSPKNELGMLLMRTGQMDEASRLMDDAMKADPYHVRVSNMRKVLKLLDGYGTLSTDHFVIRYDSVADKILARYMAEYLEEIYPGLVKQFGFEPETRTQFELYHKGKGLSAHQWFSARMVGLPWIQTVGASTGVIVALASPTALDQQFHWGRVVKHEFVHVVTLQQTKFNIPHWFTEALAVTSEETPRPAKWDTLLLERVPKKQLRILDELNDGFQRPKSPDDWQFAYCQSRLYAQYMIEKFGPETIAKMLDCYRQNIPTDKAIVQVFGISKEEFEKGYREFLDKVVAEIKVGDPPDEADEDEEPSLADLEKAYEADKENGKAAAAYAKALMEAGKREEAQAIAEAVNLRDPKNAKAATVLALLKVKKDEPEAALSLLDRALDREHPGRDLLVLIAKLQTKEGKHAEAAATLELGRKHFPRNVEILKALTAAYIKLDETDRLKEVLKTLAERDVDDVIARKKLAEFAIEAKDFAAAATYARDAIFINVMDEETHVLLGRAYVGLGEARKGVKEFETALEIAPDDEDVAVALAAAQVEAGDRDAARKTLAKVLEDNPDHKGAKALEQKLTP